MRAKVNDRFSYEWNDSEEFRVRELGEDRFEIAHGGEKFTVEILSVDLRAGSVELALDGFVFQVRMEDDLSEAIRLIRQKSDVQTGHHSVTAPIPGVIKGIHLQNGDPVVAGESVLILEAMKMENAIQAPNNGDRVILHVELGEHVRKGQELFTIY